jgi:hypothetical protein
MQETRWLERPRTKTRPTRPYALDSLRAFERAQKHSVPHVVWARAKTCKRANISQGGVGCGQVWNSEDRNGTFLLGGAPASWYDVQVCVCVCVCARACMRVQACPHTIALTCHTCSLSHMHICTRTHTHTHTTHRHLHTSRANVRARTHTHTQHTHTHTHTHSSRWRTRHHGHPRQVCVCPPSNTRLCTPRPRTRKRLPQTQSIS